MSLKLNSSGGGSVTVQEPTTASNRTLNLPDADGTVVYADGSGNVGIGTSTPGSKLGFPIGTNTIVGQQAVSAHQAGNAGFLALAVNDGGGASGVFVYNTWGGTYSSQDIRFLTAQGGVSAATERARIDSGGNLLVGATSRASVEKVNITHDGASQEGLILVNTNTAAGTHTSIGFRRPSGTTVGNITTTLSSTAYVTSSDYRLKENVQPMTGALAKVAALKPCTYTWKIDGSNGQGFIAHELADVCPQAVSGEKDATNEDGSIKPQGIDTSFLVATLTAAIQEQQQMIETLQAKVAALEAK